MREIKSVLITGGSGGFGRAFAAHLLANNMANRICIFSPEEHAQAEVRALLKNDGRLRFFIGDVRDRDRLIWAMQGVDLVVHAAALKRIEVGRYNPEEMVKTNVIGSLNVVAAAREANVDRVVALSSDKAFDPVSAYGASKALMEQIVITANENSGAHGPIFAVTRYGNVWGSPGSIMPKWVDARRAGVRRVQVSDPECTRFFMTMEEAVNLVAATANHIQPGVIAIPELPAYRLGDLAEAFGFEVEKTGLPRWEKLHESMERGNCSADARRMSVGELKRHIDAWVRSEHDGKIQSTRD